MALYRTSRDGAVIDNELLRLMAVEASFGRAGRVVIKSDAVMDEEIIQALYRASQAGVAIDLIVRGACCLRPGVDGLSKVFASLRFRVASWSIRASTVSPTARVSAETLPSWAWLTSWNETWIDG